MNKLSKATGAYLRRREAKILKRANKVSKPSGKGSVRACSNVELVKMLRSAKRTANEANSHIFMA